MALVTAGFFLFRLKVKWLKNGGAEVFIVTCILFRKFTLLKDKSDIIFSVSLSLDQNLMKLEVYNKFLIILKTYVHYFCFCHRFIYQK